MKYANTFIIILALGLCLIFGVMVFLFAEPTVSADPIDVIPLFIDGQLNEKALPSFLSGMGMLIFCIIVLVVMWRNDIKSIKK